MSLSSDQAVVLALKTIDMGKQALVFVNTKRSAEKVAEDISKKISKAGYEDLAENILRSLSRPTKQCRRLSGCVRKGIAFHHAGITQKQKDIIQDSFLKGKIKVIVATPTLAAGVDLPAFRAIIRDAKRYTSRGLQYIPVLEYMQMAGRAGRPSFDKNGEAVLIARTEAEKEELIDRYIHGEPENIYSKLAVEPVLRFYLLSLISGNFVRSRKQIIRFFSKTFWAYQYEDMDQLAGIIDRMLELLKDFGFITSRSGSDDAFMSADTMMDEKYIATTLGKRIAELYLDPVTANDFIRAMEKIPSSTGLCHMISYTNELRPLLRVKAREYDHINEKLAALEDEFAVDIPTPFDYEYDQFLNSVKTLLFFLDWMDETEEETLLEKYDIRPGEIKAKLDISDWLIYSCIEIAKILSLKKVQKELSELRLRIRHGARKELLPLLRLRNIGRVRARKLFSAGIRNIGDVKKASLTTLKQLLGPKVAEDIKSQVSLKKQDSRQDTLSFSDALS